MTTAVADALVESFVIEGSVPLNGRIRAAGNKNGALPILAACLLTDEPVTLANVPDIRDLKAWIFRVGLNAARDLQRSAYRRKVKPLFGEDIMQLADGKAPPEIVEDEESLLRIRHALMDLRPEEKEVFLLRQNGELTYEQIAQMRNCPIGTIKTQMRTALEKLRKVLA